MNITIDQRARKAKALFDFLAGWRAPALSGMMAETVRTDIVFGGDPIVSKMVNDAVSSEERESLRELAAYRRTLYDHSVMMDAGYGRNERVFANVYDALFAHLAIHGEGDADSDNYRGQLDSEWGLEASYYRSFPEHPTHRDHRADVISSFYGIHVTPIDETNIEQLTGWLTQLREKYPNVILDDLTPLPQEAVIQHYLSGTKLLDFTKSIYVAAFFATSDFSSRFGSRPSFGAIYRIASEEIDELAMGKIEAPDLPKRFRRIHCQRGVFLQVRFREAINEPGLWARWVFRHTDAAYPFCSPQHGITTEQLLPKEIWEN